MSALADQNFLRTQQYSNASNLNARINVHARFSSNKQGWQRWLFEQLRLPAQCRILELGCGPGNLWRENEDRLPPGWDLVLTDFSAGMVEQGQRSLGHLAQIAFTIADAQSIPFDNAAFAAVLANHMLYHVPNRAKALAEIRRVLRPGGRFYASTVGDGHMKELSELVQRFDPEMARSGVGLGRAYIPFSLENGGEQLRAVFDHVEIVRYPDALDVTEVAPLVDYILSGSNIEEAGAAQRDTLTRFVQTEMDRQGVIHISKDSGVFVAW